MSLETIYQNLRQAEKKISFKKLLLISFITAIGSVGIVFLNNPNYLTYYQEPLVEVLMISILIMAFMTIPMVVLGGTLAAGIMLAWFLIKCRDQFLYTNSIITGKSLSFNDTFLNYFTENLFPRLAGFIKGYNDPKFEELESRQLNSENKIDRLETKGEEHNQETRTYYRVIGEKDRIIFKLISSINQKNDLIITLVSELKQLREKDSINKQQIGNNIQAQDINENTKIDDEDMKFKPRD